MTTRAFDAITATPWAIQHDWLHVIAALALRQRATAAEMAAGIRAGYDDDDEGGPRRPPPTPAERFAASIFAAGKKRNLEGQMSGRSVVIDNVAVLPILGPIFPRSNMMTAVSGATSLAAMRQDLAAALADDAVDAIVLSVDSPGGTVAGTAEFAEAVMAARSVKPIAAHVSGLGASAAYWIASAAERIALERTSVVGSIGVVQAIPKQMGPDSHGEMTIEIVSSNAPNKRPDPTSVEGVLEVRRYLDALEDQFVGDVAQGRGVKVDHVREQFGRGGVVVGTEAVNRKMADAVENLDATIQRMSRVGRNRRKAGR